MKVYIAAPWVKKSIAIEVGERFKAQGHEITSRWFTHVGDPNDSTGAKSAIESIQTQAREDIKDVTRADVLVVLNLEKSEGKAVETGIAISNNIPVVSVGVRSNIFQTLGKEVPTVEEALEYVRSL